MYSDGATEVSRPPLGLQGRPTFIKRKLEPNTTTWGVKGVGGRLPDTMPEFENP